MVINWIRYKKCVSINNFKHIQDTEKSYPEIKQLTEENKPLKFQFN